MSRSKLSRPEAARYLTERGIEVSAKTLSNWASALKRGPPYNRSRNRCTYDSKDLAAWTEAELARRRVEPEA